jgi:hypothetical protein
MMRRETGKEQEVKALCGEGVATHPDPEPCVVVRKDGGDGSTGERICRRLSTRCGRFWCETGAVIACRCGPSAPPQLRHELNGITAIYAGEIWRTELAGCEALDMVGSGSERKIGTEEDLLC